MSRLAVAKKPGPGKHPDFSGVPGEIVSIENLVLDFQTRKRMSPYDALLDNLVEAGPGKALKFGDVRARASVTVRARKKGLKVSFAELYGVLYVRLDGKAEDTIGRTRREKILQTLKTGPRKAIALTVALRDQGDAAIDVNLVLAILGQMERSGEVIHQEGDLWAWNSGYSERSVEFRSLFS